MVPIVRQCISESHIKLTRGIGVFPSFDIAWHFEFPLLNVANNEYWENVANSGLGCDMAQSPRGLDPVACLRSDGEADENIE